MKATTKSTPVILTLIIIVLSAVASFAGVFFNGIYRDNELINAVWLGNDIVTLFVVVPAMIGTLFFSLRNSLTARIIWMGSLWYMVYNYVFYMYGAAFNKFFLLYVIVFTLSVYALVLALMKTDKQELGQHISPCIPVKWISGFMIFFAVFIGGMWIAQYLHFVFTGKVPASITQTGHSTAIVFATDLSFLVPALLVGAILLRKKELWGYLISVIVMTKCVLYPLVLVIGGMISFRKTGSWDSLMPAYIILWIGCVAAFISLIRGIYYNSSKNT